MRLEDLQPDATVRGTLPDALITVVSVEWHGSDALTLVYRGPNGRVADEILYRHDEPRLEIVEAGRPWSFDGDGALFRLVARGAPHPPGPPVRSRARGSHVARGATPAPDHGGRTRGPSLWAAELVGAEDRAEQLKRDPDTGR